MKLSESIKRVYRRIFSEIRAIFIFFLLTPGKKPYTLHIHKFFLDLSSFFNGTFRVQLDENPPDYGVFI